MKFWGITGGIGSGKSTVLDFLRQQGHPVLDADEVAASVTRPEHPHFAAVKDQIIALVGPEVFEGEVLDRSKLRDWFLEDPSHRPQLIAVLHPVIRQDIRDWMAAQEKMEEMAQEKAQEKAQAQETAASAERKSPAFIEAIHMFPESRTDGAAENGSAHKSLSEVLEGVVGVVAPLEQRLRRASERDSKSEDDVARIAKMQLSDEDIKLKSNFVIENSAGLDELREQLQKLLSKIGVFLLLCLVSLLTTASQMSYAFAPQEWFASAQSRSMGMATTAIVDDFNAVYVNPAGLALVEESQWRLPQLLNIAAAGAFLDVINQIKDLDTGGGSTISEQLQTLDGTNGGMELALLEAFWVRPRFGFAFSPIGLQGTARVKTPSLLFAQVDLYTVLQGGVAAAYGQPIFNDWVRWGVTFKPLMYRLGLRAELENSSIGTLSDNFDSFSGSGLGMDFDFGLQGDVPDWELTEGLTLKTTWGLAWQNLLASNFPIKVGANSGAAVPALTRRVNLGFAGTLKNDGIIEPLLSVEFRDLTTGYDEFLELLHIAVQLKIQPIAFYTMYGRVHYAKGNLGGGLGFSWTMFELEGGTYAENLGPGPGIGIDRRYYLQLAMNL